MTSMRRIHSIQTDKPNVFSLPISVWYSKGWHDTNYSHEEYLKHYGNSNNQHEEFSSTGRSDIMSTIWYECLEYLKRNTQHSSAHHLNSLHNHLRGWWGWCYARATKNMTEVLMNILSPHQYSSYYFCLFSSRHFHHQQNILLHLPFFLPIDIIKRKNDLLLILKFCLSRGSRMSKSQTKNNDERETSRNHLPQFVFYDHLSHPMMSRVIIMLLFLSKKEK